MARLLFSTDARAAIRHSLTRSARAAAAGSGGRALLYERGGRTFRAADGFEAARETADAQGSLSIGARILKETLAEAQRELGDGTVRLALFTAAAVAAGHRLIAAGESPGALAGALLAAAPEIDARLRACARPGLSPIPLARAQGLAEPLAEALAQALGHAGPDGAIDCRGSVPDAPLLETGTGFLIDTEPVSPLLPPAAGGRLELAHPHVLVVNDRPQDLGRLADLLDRFATRGKALAILCRGAGGAALETLVINARQPGATLTALQPRLAGPQAVALLEDAAAATGATLVDPALGTSLENLRPVMLGRAGHLLLARGLAIFRSPEGGPEVLGLRRRMIAAELERQRYLSLDRERLERRLARLSGRWAIITLPRLRGREGDEETERRLARLRKTVALARMATGPDGTIPAAGQALAALAVERGSAPAEVCLAAGLSRIAGFSADDEAEPTTMLSGIVQRAISLTATLLRIEAIVSE